MRLHNIEIPVRNLPTVDPGFIPLGLYMDAFLKEACFCRNRTRKWKYQRF